jgi:hypothetical protein
MMGRWWFIMIARAKGHGIVQQLGVEAISRVLGRQGIHYRINQTQPSDCPVRRTVLLLPLRNDLG